MFVSVLGRQPELSIAELEAVFGAKKVNHLLPEVALIDSDHFDISKLGGSIKSGEIVYDLDLEARSDKSAFIEVSRNIIHSYQKKWHNSPSKITLGISVYGFDIAPRDIQKTGLLLKTSLRKTSVSLRLIPNQDNALSTATSHNNKLGLSDNKIELIIIKDGRKAMIAESHGSQNITAYAKRDRDRPKRDAFVGMLPPKLAQIMINLTSTNSTNTATKLLDPFCGTGTVLQEALLKGYEVYGSDISPKMIDYTSANLAWLQKSHKSTGKIGGVVLADATSHQWPEIENIDIVVCETYLGQPFSAPPSPEKLKQVVGNCNHIISQFLTNLRLQITKNIKLCVAIPAWQDKNGNFTHLPLTNQLDRLGYELVNTRQLLYHRPGQVVARELLVLTVKD